MPRPNSQNVLFTRFHSLPTSMSPTPRRTFSLSPFLLTDVASPHQTRPRLLKIPKKGDILMCSHRNAFRATFCYSQFRFHVTIINQTAWIVLEVKNAESFASAQFLSSIVYKPFWLKSSTSPKYTQICATKTPSRTRVYHTWYLQIPQHQKTIKYAGRMAAAS